MARSNRLLCLNVNAVLVKYRNENRVSSTASLSIALPNMGEKAKRQVALSRCDVKLYVHIGFIATTHTYRDVCDPAPVYECIR